jgi:hypothetical protein
MTSVHSTVGYLRLTHGWGDTVPQFRDADSAGFRSHYERMADSENTIRSVDELTSTPPLTSGTVSEPEGRRVRRVGFPEMAVFAYVPYLLASCLAFASTPDDPLITLRYAANVVHGYGATFNPGQPPVQGFTSPLHLLEAVALYLIPFGHDLFKLKLASLVFGLLAVREGGRLLYGLTLPRWVQRFGCVAIATSWVIAFASGNGLETSLEAWLLATLARRLILKGPSQSPVALVCISFAAVLARPDALLAVACLMVAGCLIEGRAHLWETVRWAMGGFAAAALIGIVGVAYFHEWAPNTYFAKQVDLGRAVHYGWAYLQSSFQPGGTHPGDTWSTVAFALLWSQVVLLVLGTTAIIVRRRRCGYLLAIGIAQTLFVLKTGGDWMVGGRFVAPAMIPIIVVQLLGAVGLAYFLIGRISQLLYRATATVLSLVLVATSIVPFRSVNAPIDQLSGVSDAALIKSGFYGTFSVIWSALPRVFSCLPSGTLVAVSETGTLGFLRQDLQILDLRGLTNRAIATESPTSVKWPPGVVDSTWYLPTSAVGRVIVSSRPAVIADLDAPPRNSVFGGRYVLSQVLAFPPYQLSIYLARDRHFSCLRGGAKAG